MRFSRFLVTLVLTFVCVRAYPTLVNKIVASVGNFPITTYDIEMTEKFLQTTTGNNPSNKVQPLKELLFLYSLEQIVNDNKKIILPKDEIEKMMQNLTNLEDETNDFAFQRAEIAKRFPEEMKMQLKKGQLVRALLFYDTRLKEKANEKIDEREITNFYKKNEKSFIDQPYLDLVIVVCEQPKTSSLEELEKFENTLDKIAARLKKSNDISDLLTKYRKFLNPEPYSGRTSLKPVSELFQSGYPEELLAFSLSTNVIQTSRGNLYVKPGFSIGPEKIKFRNSPKNYYFVLKVVDRKIGSTLPLEKVRNIIEAQLKEKKIYDALKDLIIDKINKKELQIVLYDEKYKGEYDEFLRR